MMQNKRKEAIYYTIKKRFYLEVNVTGQPGSAEFQGIKVFRGYQLDVFVP